MSDEPKLECVWTGTQPLVDVVLVHGLTGDARETWENGSENGVLAGVGSGTIWARFRCTRSAILRVSSRSGRGRRWTSSSAQSNTLERLAGLGIGERPIAFVSHSLGGILTKIILRKAAEGDDEDLAADLGVDEAGRVPVDTAQWGCNGESGGRAAACIEIDQGPGERGGVSRGPERTLPQLRERQGRSRHGGVLREASDQRGTGRIEGVRRPGSRPGPVPVDKNHADICKPTDKGDIIYLGVKRHVQKVVNTAAQSNSGALGLTQGEEYTERSTRDRRDLLRNSSMQVANTNMGLRMTTRIDSRAHTLGPGCLRPPARTTTFFCRNWSRGS